MKMLGFKLITLLVVMGLVMPMLLPGPDGKPIMTLDDWIPRDFLAAIGKLGDDVAEAVDNSVSAVETEVVGAGAQIYSWRDERGVLHYSDTPVEGASPLVVPHDGLAIPADRFVQSGLAPAANDAPAPRPKSRLLKERDPLGRDAEPDKPKSKAGLDDLQALGDGDFSNAAAVLENLPELLEQARAAREIPATD